MPARVRILERIVVNVGIPVPSLDALGLQGDDAVCLGEAVKIRVVPLGIIKHQAEVVGVGILAGVGVVGGHDSAGVADFSPGGAHRGPAALAHFGGDCPGGVGGKKAIYYMKKSRFVKDTCNATIGLSILMKLTKKL
jgi:hypothetical protein